MAETQDPSREPALCPFSLTDQETPWTEHSFTQAVSEYLLSPRQLCISQIVSFFLGTQIDYISQFPFQLDVVR